jgi:type I restriction enzyme S subunit
MYLKALLLSQPIRLQLDTFATGGTMPVLSAGIIRRLAIPIIGLSEQSRITDVLNAIDKNNNTQIQSLVKLCILKTGLMHDLLTGQRRVTPLLTQPAS